MFDFPLRPDEQLDRVSWPSLEEIDCPSVSDGDVLLLCAGFEIRAVETLRRLCERPVPQVSVVLVEYQPAYGENRSREIRQLAKSAGMQLSTVLYNRRKPAGIADDIGPLVGSTGRLWVDVSGMSRLLIVQTLVGLLSRGSQTVTILYGEAETYPPSKAEFESTFQVTGHTARISYLSSGVFEIAVAPELSSVAMLGEATRLIAFPSFDPSQLSNVLDELQPTYTDLIHGVPPRVKNHWRRKAIEQLHGPILRELLGREDHEVSTLDYTETLRLLVNIYHRRNSFDRFVVCPTGSKMQAVAVGLFRAAVTDVQVVYPTPQSFVKPDRYTLGVKCLYQLQVPETVFSEEDR